MKAFILSQVMKGQRIGKKKTFTVVIVKKYYQKSHTDFSS